MTAKAIAKKLKHILIKIYINPATFKLFPNLYVAFHYIKYKFFSKTFQLLGFLVI